jgi:hypothetical protein
LSRSRLDPPVFSRPFRPQDCGGLLTQGIGQPADALGWSLSTLQAVKTATPWSQFRCEGPRGWEPQPCAGHLTRSNIQIEQERGRHQEAVVGRRDPGVRRPPLGRGTRPDAFRDSHRMWVNFVRGASVEVYPEGPISCRKPAPASLLEPKFCR